MSLCDRINCGYWYADADEDYPSCHSPDDLHPAPCEEEDDDPFHENDPYVVTNPMAFY